MNKILTRRKQKERKERIKRILGAARKVFLEKGYFKTNIRDIAREAELSPGTIYHYFGGINELYAELCDESFTTINQILDREAKTTFASFKKIEYMAQSLANFYITQPEYFDLFAFRELGWKRVRLNPELTERLDRALYKAISTLRNVIDEGIRKKELKDLGDSWQISYALWSGIEGALSINRRGLLDNANIKIEELINVQLQTYIMGLWNKH
jgi:AcrR family transcriptional regulator